MGFQLLLVLQRKLQQRRQGVAGPALGFLAQALMQADDLLHQGGEEAPGQRALLGQQRLELQAELVGLALQGTQFALVGLQLEQWRVDAVQRVLFAMPAIDRRHHLVGPFGFLFEDAQVLLHRAEEMQDRQVDPQRGQAAGQAAAQAGQVFFQPLRADRRAQQLALALQQALVGLQVEQTLVVAVVLVACARGELQQHLAAALLVTGEQVALLDDLSRRNRRACWLFWISAITWSTT